MNADGTTLEQTVLDNLATFLSQDKLRELLRLYLNDSQQILTQLNSVLTENNVVETTRLMHSLKSTSANIGAMKISELAKSLEALARREQLEEIREQVAELTGLFDQTRSDIEQLDFMQS